MVATNTPFSTRQGLRTNSAASARPPAHSPKARPLQNSAGLSAIDGKSPSVPSARRTWAGCLPVLHPFSASSAPGWSRSSCCCQVLFQPAALLTTARRIPSWTRISCCFCRAQVVECAPRKGMSRKGCQAMPQERPTVSPFCSVAAPTLLHGSGTDRSRGCHPCRFRTDSPPSASTRNHLVPFPGTTRARPQSPPAQLARRNECSLPDFPLPAFSRDHAFGFLTLLAPFSQKARSPNKYRPPANLTTRLNPSLL